MRSGHVQRPGGGRTRVLPECDSRRLYDAPDPNWDFEPDVVTIKKQSTLSVVNQGGEPHTFTEVSHFGGGFFEPLNGGEDVVPECAGGFANLAVAKTRILQGSHLDITGLSKGTHLFECCIHPWMRVEVDVK
jgi:plastocyanin